jgi:hypothetical protein
MTDSGTKSVIRRTQPIPGQAPAGDEENIPEDLKSFPYIRVPHGLAGTRLHFPKKMIHEMYYKKQTPRAEIHQGGRLVASLKDHTCPTCKLQMPAANAGAHHEEEHKAFRCTTCKLVFRGTKEKEGHMGAHNG